MSKQHVWSLVSEDEDERMKKCFNEDSPMLGMYKSTPGDVRMPSMYVNRGYEKMKHFKIRPDDIFILSYPKTGTTMTLEIIWQILHDLDESGLKLGEHRVPFLEACDTLPAEMMGMIPVPKGMELLYLDGYKYADEMDSPRFLKTHMPMDFLPDKLLDEAKAVYVCRNPIDAGVSYYHHHKTFGEYGLNCTLDEFLELFMRGEVEFGDYWHHLQCGWEKRNHPNMKFLWYEDIRADLKGTIKDIAEFLGKPFPGEKVDKLADLMDFSNFKK